jgi:hypothetical protein
LHDDLLWINLSAYHHSDDVPTSTCAEENWMSLYKNPNEEMQTTGLSLSSDMGLFLTDSHRSDGDARIQFWTCS